MERNLWVTRKGATSARKGQLGIIPGSMGTGSFIVKGGGTPPPTSAVSWLLLSMLNRGVWLGQSPGYGAAAWMRQLCIGEGGAHGWRWR